MLNIPPFLINDSLLFIKAVFLIFVFLFILGSFILLNQVKSLNKVVTILASFSSGTLQVVTIIYFLALVSLFLTALVIL